MSASQVIDAIKAEAPAKWVCVQCKHEYLPRFKWQDEIEEFCCRNCQKAFNFEHNPPAFVLKGKQTFMAEQFRYKQG